MVNFSGLQSKWEAIQNSLFAYHNNIVTIYYPTTYSGSNSSYDGWGGEGLDPNNPMSGISGVVDVTTPPISLSGVIATYNYGPVITGDIQHMPVGYFTNQDVILTCKITDVVVSGQNIFEKADYITIDGDSEKYVVSKMRQDGLGKPYVYYIGMNKTNR